MFSIQLPTVRPSRPPWNKGRLIGQKRPLKPRQVWAIRARLELAGNQRNLVLFNLAIDSKLRGCDLVRLKISRETCLQRLLGKWLRYGRLQRPGWGFATLPCPATY